MKTALALVALAGLVAPAPAMAASAAPTSARFVAAPSATAAQNPPSAKAAAAGSTALVARYTFDGGITGGRVADTSGRAPALTVRSADQGVIRYVSDQQGRYIAFPGVCASGAKTCPRGLLEAADDADLNPGTRMFRWSARINVTKAQVSGSANVLQKGVATTASQWKMQIGRTQGRAQCVVVGTGNATAYVVKSTISVADGKWHKVLCQRSGGTLTVFVDDQARGQRTIPSGLSITNKLPLRVGGPNFNARSDMYHGLLDDVYAELG